MLLLHRDTQGELLSYSHKHYCLYCFILLLLLLLLLGHAGSPHIHTDVIVLSLYRSQFNAGLSERVIAAKMLKNTHISLATDDGDDDGGDDDDGDDGNDGDDGDDVDDDIVGRFTQLICDFVSCWHHINEKGG